MIQHRLVIVDMAGLGWDLVRSAPELAARYGLTFRPLETVFPALTCPVQASFRTAAHPCFHGITANGFYARRLARAFFWEQSAALVYGRRIWTRYRAAGRRVGLLFWQHSLGEEADVVLSPRPVHRHHGGLIPDCHSVPEDLYARLRSELGRPFPLHHYWGPRASLESSRWIADASCALMENEELAPDLLLVYLPHLDYDLQRFGPDTPEARMALEKALALVGQIWSRAREVDADVLLFGDYAIAPVTGAPIYLSREFRRHGLFRTRRVKGRLYPDMFDSRAIALADHEIALVYARSDEDARAARRLLDELDGVGLVLDPAAQRELCMDEPLGPDLVAVAEPGRWFAYPWWDQPREAPDFAAHVDIHAKPGYDPCELLPGRWPGRISMEPEQIRGTHGRAGRERMVAWAASFEVPGPPRDLLDLARAVETLLGSRPPE
ncbi:MAG: alkaline phosphatase family protein [Kiritimatiellae bacterium]|nr:alkaline phosphatase family protein [Kiritimatiellia bacterium]